MSEMNIQEMIRRAHRMSEAHTVIRTVLQSRCEDQRCEDMAGNNACPGHGCGRCDVTARKIMDALLEIK